MEVRPARSVSWGKDTARTRLAPGGGANSRGDHQQINRLRAQADAVAPTRWGADSLEAAREAASRRWPGRADRPVRAAPAHPAHLDVTRTGADPIAPGGRGGVSAGGGRRERDR